MHVSVDSNQLGEMLPLFFVIMMVLCVGLWAIYAFVKKQDNNKELFTKKVKVLEKVMQQGDVAWYVFECENGERLKLRSFKANSIFITEGDVGTLSYKGQTIQEFKREV